MARAREYDKTALVMGVLSTSETRREELIKVLTQNFGPVFKISSTIDFSFTDYYNDEMSGRPVRYFIMFNNLVDPSTLADIKTKTNEIELLFADNHGRRVNLDPGILSLASFILATCKDRSHRIPLKNGIYGETTLIFQDHDFQRLPWTYADYSCDEVKEILRDFRLCYKRMINN